MHEKKQKNATHDEKKSQLIETDTELTHILQLAVKDIEAAITICGLYSRR